MQQYNGQRQTKAQKALAKKRKGRRKRLNQPNRTGRKSRSKMSAVTKPDSKAGQLADSHFGLSRRKLLYTVGGGTLLSLCAFTLPEVRYLTGLQRRPDKMVRALEAFAAMSQDGKTAVPGESASLEMYQTILGVNFQRTINSYLKPLFPKETIISVDFGGGDGSAAAAVNRYEGVEVFVLDRGGLENEFGVTGNKNGPLLPINRYIIRRAEATDLKSEIFHHIFSHNATQYFNLEYALPEMYRLLKVGGVAQFDFEGWRKQSEVMAKSPYRKNMYITTAPMSLSGNAASPAPLPSTPYGMFPGSSNGFGRAQEHTGPSPIPRLGMFSGGASISAFPHKNGVMWRGNMDRFLATISDLSTRKEGSEFLQLVLMHPSVLVVRTEEGKLIGNIEREVGKEPLSRIVSHPGASEGLVDAYGRSLSLPEAMKIAGMTHEKAKKLLHQFRTRRKRDAELWEKINTLQDLEDLKKHFESLKDASPGGQVK